MRRKHHLCYQRRFTRLASRYRSLFTFALAFLALLFAPNFKGAVRAQDTVSPVFVSASTDGANVTITFSEEVFVSPLVRYVKEWSGAPLQLFLRAAFGAYINGHEISTQELASLSGTDLTLRMAYFAGPGDEVQVAYNNIFVRNAGGLLVDAAGNAVPYFSNQTVQNNAGSPGSNLADGAVLTPGEITIPEGRSGTYTVALASQPSENVTVNVMPYAIVQVTPTQLTFTPDNWDAPQTVTVSTYDDNDSIDAWAAVLHQLVGDNNANWTFVKIVVDDQDPPLVVSGSTSTDYAENGTSPVATYSVANAASAITWSLFGYDKSDFSISSAGVLTFNTPPDHENPVDSNEDNAYQVTIQASDGTSTGALLDVAINVTDEPPAVASITSSATHPTKEGFTVTISFSEPVTGLTADEIEVTNGTGSNFAGAGAVYTLDIAPNAGIEDDVTVTVTAGVVVDGVNNGNRQASEAFPVDTKAPTVSTIAIASDPGTDAIYAAGDEIRATVTFSETVGVAGTPQMTLKVGSEDRAANYQSGIGAALVFAYEVDEEDEATDGVSIEADSLTLNGGMIIDRATNLAVLVHGAVDPQSGHKVDGVKPQLAATGGAVVSATTLTLTYDEPLDGSSAPVPEDFTVDGGDQTRTVTGVRVNGSAVELTLDVGAGHLEAGIQVSYTPGTNPIRDVPGNEAEALSREPVANDTPDTTEPDGEQSGHHLESRLRIRLMRRGTRSR